MDKSKGFEAKGVEPISKPFPAKDGLARVEVHFALRRGMKGIQAQNAQREQEILKSKHAEQKRAEEALRMPRKELEERAMEQTKDLTGGNEELVVSKEHLEEQLNLP